MKQGIGQSQSITIISIFILISFAFIVGILSYSKAHKINSELARIIEAYEGNVGAAKEEINRVLGSLGYSKQKPNCSQESNFLLDTTIDNFDICLYYYNDSSNKKTDRGYGKYYNYKIRTYITFDFPVVNQTLRLPVNSRTERMYYFNENRS